MFTVLSSVQVHFGHRWKMSSISILVIILFSCFGFDAVIASTEAYATTVFSRNASDPNFELVIDNNNEIHVHNLSTTTSKSTTTTENNNNTGGDLESVGDHSLLDLYKKQSKLGAGEEDRRYNSLDKQPLSDEHLEEHAHRGYSFYTNHHNNHDHDNNLHPDHPSTTKDKKKSRGGKKRPSHHVPSFSKMPDYLNDFFSSEHESNDNYNPNHNHNQPEVLKVPIGSRVHTIKYKDVSPEDMSSYNSLAHSDVFGGNHHHHRGHQRSKEQVVKTFYNEFHPSIVEIPSSKAELPIVFNFETKSSPIIARQMHRSPPAGEHNVQYFESNEPPHFSQHIVHRPIFQDIREVIVPYRFYIQSIDPVQELRQTNVPVAHNLYQPQQHQFPPMASPHGMLPNSPLHHMRGLEPHVTYHQAGDLLNSPSSEQVYDHQDNHQHDQTMSPYFKPELSSEQEYLENAIAYAALIQKNPYVAQSSVMKPMTIADLYQKPYLYEEPGYIHYDHFNKYNV